MTDEQKHNGEHSHHQTRAMNRKLIYIFTSNHKAQIDKNLTNS